MLEDYIKVKDLPQTVKLSLTLPNVLKWITIKGRRIPIKQVNKEISGIVSGIGNMFKKVSPTEFILARSKSTRAGFLTPYNHKELKDMKVFLSHDKKTGYAITPEKELVNLFNNGGPPGSGKIAVHHAISEGADNLSCFDDFLPDYYKKFGFKETDRMKWDDQYAPPGWNYEKMGRPDVVIMKLEKK